MKVNPIKSFFESKPMQKFYKKVCDPKYNDFWSTTMPTFETCISTGLYIWATEKQKDIPRDQKNVLQYQNVLSGIAGVAIGGYMSKKAMDVANKIIPKLDKKIYDMHKIEAGLKMLLPITVVGVLMRMVLPTVTAQISFIAEEIRRKKAKNNSQLDIKA